MPETAILPVRPSLNGRKPFKNPFKNADFRKEAAAHAISLVSQIDLDRSSYLEDQKRWYAFYRGFIGDRSSIGGSADGWANTHVPITAWSVLKFHESVMAVLSESDPRIFLKPKNSVAQKFKESVRVYLESVLEDEDQMNIDALIDEWVLHLGIHGGITGFIGWERWRDFAEETQIIDSVAGESYLSMSRRVLADIFPESRFENLKRTSTKTKEGTIYSTYSFIEILKDNLKVPGTAEIEMQRVESPPDSGNTALEITLRRYVLRERPVVDVPPVEFTFKTNDYAYRGIDRCTMVGRRLILTLDEIQQGFATNKYDLLTEKDMKELIEAKSGKVRTDQTSSVDQVRESVQGYTRSYARQELGEFDACEIFWLYDAMKTGTPQQWIVTFLQSPQKVLRARLLSDVFKLRGGRRPVFHIDLIPDTNSSTGIGIPELVEPVQIEVNEIHSIGLDWGHMDNAPWFFYRQTSNLRPNLRLIKPGSGVPLDDPQSDVFFPQRGGNSQGWAINQEALSMGYLERLFLPEVSYGRIPAGKSAALRTFGTSRSLMARGDVKLETFLRRIKRGLSRLISIVHDLERTERQIPLVYRLPDEHGNLEFQELPRDAMESPFSYQYAPNSLSADKEFQTQQAGLRLQTVSNPIAIQLGVTTPKNFYEAQKDLIRQLGGDDVDRFVTVPKDASAIPVINGTQALQWIQLGQLPPISPLADTNEQIGTIMAFLNSPERLAMPPDQQALLLQYIGLLQRAAAEAMQRQQMMQAASQMMGQGNMEGMGMMRNGTPGPAAMIGPDMAPTDLTNMPMEFSRG